ncbi:unnamed protein product [Linum trigynum]|uniref:Uncharacterized protein n=1 Tax=Linum trigynum TaxID=586398 RepID=A0AAV2F5Q7_9ROSI
MEWNLKAASNWDWDNITGCGGGFSGSDSGHGSSSKSSVEGLPDYISKKHLSIVGNVENFSTMDASASSGEQIIGLKLDKRTYFEDVCAPGNAKSSSVSASKIASSFVAAGKRTRASCQSLQSPCCQVEGCNLDLKFHELSDYNARCRRPQPEALQFGSTLSASIYDNRWQMNIMWNRVPLPAKSFTWPSSCGLKFAQAGDSFLRYAKTEGMSRQMGDLSNELNDSTSTLPMISDKGLSFRSSTPQIFNQGFEGSAVTCNQEMNPELGGALPLLSTTSSWGMNEPLDSAPFDQLMLVNETIPAVQTPSHSNYFYSDQMD